MTGSRQRAIEVPTPGLSFPLILPTSAYGRDMTHEKRLLTASYVTSVVTRKASAVSSHRFPWAEWPPSLKAIDRTVC